MDANKIPEPLEDLDHDALDLRLREGRLHVVEERGEVLLAVLHDEEDGAEAASHGDLPQPHDVVVLAAQEHVDLAQAGHRHPVLLAVHPHALLQRRLSSVKHGWFHIRTYVVIGI